MAHRFSRENRTAFARCRRHLDSRLVWLLCLAFLGLLPLALHAQRDTVSLDGTWQIEDSVAADVQPAAYTHTVPVPGLAHLAQPAFADVDKFQSREFLNGQLFRKAISLEEYQKLGNASGISQQKRNYFWYRRTFTAGRRRSVALLKVAKAQFGITVYLNGKMIGSHAPCFTAAYFDATKAIRWNAENTVVIRVGAHPGVLPGNVSGGRDVEKNLWTPGIYDDVALLAMDDPVITNVQVAPDIDHSTILIATELHNTADRAIVTSLAQTVTAWKGESAGLARQTMVVHLAPGETKTVQQTVSIPREHLWSPEDPFLYAVTTKTAGDEIKTRFGMREFHFDTATQRAYLNGKVYFLRGSNVALHRYFEDPQSGALPWNDAWVRKLLVDIPHQMHWNAFRFCIGPVPDHWLEIADEAGLLIQNEYMVWDNKQNRDPKAQPVYDADELIGEFTEWMRDNWNHPSVVIWDATNESVLPVFSEKIVPAVRKLDLSHRPWEDSYNPPGDANDPVEDHIYLWMDSARSGQKKFDMADLEQEFGFSLGVHRVMRTNHAMILNEYGWLWLNRDGSPTTLTGKLYPLLLGPDATADQRFALQAYLLAGETEYWRAYRRFAAVEYFTYLSGNPSISSAPDNFIDTRTLTLAPHFMDYMQQAFKPLGAYINFWHPTLEADAPHDFTILLTNDDPVPRKGTIRLSFLGADGSSTGYATQDFNLAALGGETYQLSLAAPSVPGKYTLQASVAADGNTSDPTLSRRWVTITARSATKESK